MIQDDASVFAAMRAGARGYVLKDGAPGQIIRAIQAVGDGETILARRPRVAPLIVPP